MEDIILVGSKASSILQRLSLFVSPRFLLESFTRDTNVVSYAVKEEFSIDNLRPPVVDQIGHIERRRES